MLQEQRILKSVDQEKCKKLKASYCMKKEGQPHSMLTDNIEKELLDFTKIGPAISALHLNTIAPVCRPPQPVLSPWNKSSTRPTHKPRNIRLFCSLHPRKDACYILAQAVLQTLTKQTIISHLIWFTLLQKKVAELFLLTAACCTVMLRGLMDAIFMCFYSYIRYLPQTMVGVPEVKVHEN